MKFRAVILSVCGLVLGTASGGALAANAPRTFGPEFLAGSWEGRGTYDGNELELSREWTAELGGQFLQADMRVTMSNGASFRILTYWKRNGDRRYDVVWMDELGRLLRLEALEGENAGAVSMNYLDDFTETGTAWRRSVYRITGEDSYSEELFGQTENGWERLALFTFKRLASE